MEAGIDPATRGKVGITYDRTLKITTVIANGPAASAGLKVGDRIVEIDGIPVTYSPELALKVTGTPASTVVFKVSRSEQLHDFTVVRGQP